jgi:hypothetical protein
MTRYFFTNELEVLETVRRAMQHSIEMHMTDCSGYAFGFWIDMDLAGLTEQEEKYLTEFAEKETTE